MATKAILFAFFAIFAAVCSAGVVPVPAAYVAPYASTYNAHVINHAVAAPVAAPLVAAAPVLAAPAAYAAYNHFGYNAPLVYAK